MNSVTPGRALRPVESDRINPGSSSNRRTEIRGGLQGSVAIASSGLGYVNRGNESWALTVAQALHQSGVPVTLFGSKPSLPAICPYIAVKNWRREQPLTRGVLNWHRRYLLEQVSFELGLRRSLRRHCYDIIHVADPILALRLSKSERRFRYRVVYKDGLSLGPSWCSKFNFVQVLAPYYLELAKAEGYDTTGWFTIPHIADVEHFRPVTDQDLIEKMRFEKRLAPTDFVVLAVGDLAPESNKRLGWILEEVALSGDENIRCVIVGQSSSREFEQFSKSAKRQLGRRVQIHTNVSKRQMAGWYQIADVLAHAALREPFGIVFLEAMASGLPILAHRFPVTEWIVSEGGVTIDMTARGELCNALKALHANRDLRLRLAENARLRAVGTFGPDKIVKLYEELYRYVLSH